MTLARILATPEWRKLKPRALVLGRDTTDMMISRLLSILIFFEYKRLFRLACKN